MKLIIREYLASLKEREELDAILPDLLSELGFNVYSRPGRGTTQHGVDIAAVGKDMDDGEKKLFLFSVKRGDLTRQDWDGTPQALRSSLNSIKDAYIPSYIPPRYKNLKIIICLCFGGDIQEQVRPEITGYINQNTTEQVSFTEWNGDKIAELLLKGVLREEILPKPLRSSFQKAVAMVDEPDISYNHFLQLVQQLRKQSIVDHKSRIRVARQLYCCLWILFVWARDVDNVEAPYQASELALLHVWDLLRNTEGKGHIKNINIVLNQLIKLHIVISSEFLDKKILPHVGKKDALALAVNARSHVDVNLKLFDILGRISMKGLWHFWNLASNGVEFGDKEYQYIGRYIDNGIMLINSNPALCSPLCDEHAIEIILFLFLALLMNKEGNIKNWLDTLVQQMDFSILTHGKYPCIYTDYSKLINHPFASDEYQKEATAGSILIPSLAVWCSALGRIDALNKLSELVHTRLKHCTLQAWLPDKDTENDLYVGKHGHGVAILDLPISSTGKELVIRLQEACKNEDGFKKLSSNIKGFWPITLTACRHYRHPIPPQFWLDLLTETHPIASE